MAFSGHSHPCYPSVSRSAKFSIPNLLALGIDAKKVLERWGSIMIACTPANEHPFSGRQNAGESAIVSHATVTQSPNDFTLSCETGYNVDPKATETPNPE